MSARTFFSCLAGFMAMPVCLQAQQTIAANYDEALTGSIPLPEVLTCADGTKITSKEDWLSKRKPELMRLFQNEMYGKTPSGKAPALRFVTTSENKKALGGKATMRQVTIYFTDKNEPHCDILLYLPNGRKQPSPCFVSLNFGGNHAVADDATIKLCAGWFRDDAKKGYINHRATEQTRASSVERWPVGEIIARGYGVCTAYYGDLEPDHVEGMSAGVRPLYLKNGHTAPAADEWGAIGAWAWGLSRMADYLTTLPEVDAAKLAVLGHSRLGKTSLWAGAQDERFGIVISNDSGAGGAALSKRIFGETCAVLNKNFPHWFNGNFKKYSNNEAALPVDQHELIALMAPRPVYIASATKDLWADPKGEFLSGKLAEPVYALFGKKGLGVSEPPAPDTSVGDTIGYHNRSGAHDILLYDWQCFMEFADKHWGHPK